MKPEDTQMASGREEQELSELDTLKASHAELLEALNHFVSSLTRDGKNPECALSIDHAALRRGIERARAAISNAEKL